MTSVNPVFCAIDSGDLDEAERLATRVAPHVGGLKLGLEFFLAHGAAGYRRVAALGLPIFLDLKLHDIPNTVAGAVASLLPLRPVFLTLHASGGPAMLKAAAAACGTGDLKLLAVTVLTSLDSVDLTAVGQDGDVTAQVTRLASLAQGCGVNGAICSPQEIKPLRGALGPDFVLMVPGIRPDWAQANDQKRVMTPRQAVEAGATHLVIGRPITAAPDPAEAARRIAAELA